jgi:hypothetical protein
MQNNTLPIQLWIPEKRRKYNLNRINKQFALFLCIQQKVIDVSGHQLFFFCGAATQRGSWPHSWGFPHHTQRRTTVGRTPLDEWSAGRRDLYLTTHNTHKRQTSMPPGGIRTQDLSRRSAANLRLRPRGHWDRHISCLKRQKHFCSGTLWHSISYPGYIRKASRNTEGHNTHLSINLLAPEFYI